MLAVPRAEVARLHASSGTTGKPVAMGYVTPSYMLAILDEFRRQGRDPRKTSLKIGIFSAETLDAGDAC
jgi:phenylacetate-coenzyme A ligase PaaK-like adenylate-forming protein